MKSLFQQSLLMMMMFLSGLIQGGDVWLTLNGTDPLTLNLRGETQDEPAGNISVYLYFRDDGVTDLQPGGVDASQISGTGPGQFGWGNFLELIQFEGEGQPVSGGPWTIGANTYTRRVLYDNAEPFNPSQENDFWTMAGIDAIVYDFTTVGTGHVFIEVNGPDGLSDWYGDLNHTPHYTNQDISLPVELSSFTAEFNLNKVELNWITESEVNNLGFQVYRAFEEGADYSLLSSYETNSDLMGQGNSNTRHEYNYTDESIEPETTYWYKLADVDLNGVKTFHSPVSVTVPKMEIPAAFKLHSNYPNPFNPTTTLRFDIPQTATELVDTRLVIYNSLGQLIKTLYKGNRSPGSYEVQWDGSNDFGSSAPSGVYFVVLHAGNFTQTGKLLLLK